MNYEGMCVISASYHSLGDWQAPEAWFWLNSSDSAHVVLF